ncbi:MULTISPECIES: monovalent cation/H(+) antiporter subunit G [unclassified Streptomyces]|uniref:monovalent cation/H(+) antiporter subunit G n=1 Tax=unclassified Streptomyces TaxID=2593676 RepID=UPI002349AEE0|nr:monovalent cation/H(+) antiporter subunit G [Streptomyces sp. M92]WCN04437.1 monovalent cation/H(+) antiporter subunit G [Streptomyces sp. M92]
MNAWTEAADLIGVVLLFLGCLQCLLGVIGMLRLPDVLSRSHAATKPQTLGILLVLAGVTLRLRHSIDMGTLALIVFFQFLTSPVASHLVARSAYRTGQTGSRGLLRDDLDPQLSDGEQRGE